MNRLLDFLPRGLTVDDAEWERRHRFLLAILAATAPALAIFGFATDNGPVLTLSIVAIPVLTTLGGWFARGRHVRSLFVTIGMTADCAGLVILSGGMIEAHFSFFVIIGFLTLYQHWVPFVWNIAFTTISHGLGSALVPSLMFNHHMGQMNPWLWSTVHGIAVLAACIGVMMFCRITEDEQGRRAALAKELSDAQIRQREFTSEMLLNLARRNQSMFGRQLDIINDLEEREHDPDTLAELFRLDHLATRVRRNAESLLVLSGEQPPRVWSAPVPLRDVVRAGIAETEDLDRVVYTVDERPRLIGNAVADLTHVVAELAENAVRFSSPTSPVTVQSRPYQRVPGAQLLIVEDTGIGMPPDELAAANVLLAHTQEVDLAASRRLGFHVVSRLAARHGIEVSLTPTPGGGVTAVLALPVALFAEPAEPAVTDGRHPATGSIPAPAAPVEGPRVGALAGAGRHSWPGGPNGHVGNGHVGNGDLTHGHHQNGQHGTGQHENGHSLDDAPVPEEAAEVATAPEPARSETDHVSDERTEPPRPVAPSAIAPRRALIHPVVVPPPAADARTTTGGSAPEHDHTALAPAPRRPADSGPATPRHVEAASGATAAPVGAPSGTGGSPTLKRRVPQSHLAPELIRAQPGRAAATPAPAAAPATATSGAPVGRGTSGISSSGMPSPGMSSLDALSRYQASRQAARSEIGDTDPAGPSSEETTHDR